MAIPRWCKRCSIARARRLNLRATVLEFHDIAPEVRHFVFEVPEVQQLHFKAGPIRFVQ